MAAINDKLQEALNGQINAELFSSYLYLSMSAYFASQDLPGFASWMRVQAQEEDSHVQKFFNYIIERGGRVVLEAIDKPQTEWSSPLEAFQEALAHEEHITSRIGDLVELAMEHKDRATQSFLQWFVDEQVEEEASVDQVIKAVKLGAGQPVAMLMLDRELAARIFTPPAGSGAGQ
jgi:ferritin